MSTKIVSARVYGGVYAALIALTALTVGLSFLDVGGWLLAAGLAIAAAKGAFVVFVFMHLLQSRLNWLMLAAGLFWLAILLGFTLLDYLTRIWLVY